MGSLTRTEMNSEVASIIDRTDKTTAIDTRLQWAMDEIAGLHPWRILQGEDTSTVLVPGVKNYAIPSTIRTISSVRVVDTTSDAAKYMRAYFDSKDFYDDHPYIEGQDESQPSAWIQLGSNIITNYTPGTDHVSVVKGSDSNYYRCIVDHTSAAATKPTTGGDYATRWTAITTHTGDDWVTDTNYFVQKLYIVGNKWPTAFAGDSSTSDLDKTLDKAMVYSSAAMVFEMLQEEQVAQYWHQKTLDVVGAAWATEEGLNII